MESRDLLYSLINRIYGLGGWGSCPFKETVLGVLLLSESPEDFHQPLGLEGVVSILGQLTLFSGKGLSRLLSGRTGTQVRLGKAFQQHRISSLQTVYSAPNNPAPPWRAYHEIRAQKECAVDRCARSSVWTSSHFILNDWTGQNEKHEAIGYRDVDFYSSWEKPDSLWKLAAFDWFHFVQSVQRKLNYTESLHWLNWAGQFVKEYLTLAAGTTI